MDVISLHVQVCHIVYGYFVVLLFWTKLQETMLQDYFMIPRFMNELYILQVQGYLWQWKYYYLVYFVVNVNNLQYMDCLIQPQPQLWIVWNSSNMWMNKRTKTRSIHIHKFEVIALNDCFWVNWHSWGEKMFKTIKFCENCFSTRYSYPNRVGVHWGSPTPLANPRISPYFLILITFGMNCLGMVNWQLIVEKAVLVYLFLQTWWIIQNCQFEISVQLARESAHSETVVLLATFYFLD